MNPFNSGAVVEWLNFRTHNTGVGSSNPTLVTIKMPLERKATGNHLIKLIFLETSSEPCLWLLLRSKSSMQHSYQPSTAGLTDRWLPETCNNLAQAQNSHQRGCMLWPMHVPRGNHLGSGSHFRTSFIM